MTTEEILEVLQSTDFTRDLEPRHLERLASLASVVEFAEGETIFREGDIGETLFLIEEGLVAVDTHIPGRGRVRILTVAAGQLLGWSSLFSQMHKTATARVVTPTRALAFDATQLRAICEADYELGCALGWRMAELIAGRLKATRMQLLDMFAPVE